MMDINDPKTYEMIADGNIRFLKVSGAPGTGKTAALLKRAAYLVEAGVSPESIAIFTATVSAADGIAARLADSEDTRLARICISTPRGYAIEMLSDPAVRALTGRNPRILKDFEERILMEDLKVVGIKPKRMREMLKFFYRQWSELGDENEDFIQSSEERMLHDAIKTHLRLREAMMVEELSNVAYRYLRDANGEARKSGNANGVVQKWCFEHVLVDDFQNMSKATQMMLESLGDKSLMVCGNENEQVPTDEPYPNADGFARFADEHAGTVEVALGIDRRSGARITRMGNALIAQDSMKAEPVAEVASEAPEGTVKLVEWTLPNAEFLGLADYVAQRTAGGPDSVHPHRIGIIVPNALWGRALAKVLGDRNIKTSLMLSYHALDGDPRVMEKCKALRAFVGLNLVHDPNDATAWRDWCGFGEYLTNSNHWCRLEEYAQASNVTIAEALALLANASADGTSECANDGAPEAFLGANVLVARYRAGRALIDRATGKQGFALLNDLIDNPVEGLPAGFAELVEPVMGNESAQELYERACARIDIRFSDEDAVRIGLPEMFCGLEFDTIILAGAVDGFYPSTDTFGEKLDEERQNELRNEERRSLYAAITKASRTVVISCFQRDDANTASALGMWVRRIRVIDGKRFAILSPSSFIDEFGQTVPGFDAKL